MSSLHVTTNLTNPHYINVWRKTSSQAIQDDPNDQAALLVHYALNTLHEMYVKNIRGTQNPLHVRQDIFKYLQQAAMSGCKAAKLATFYEGLARLEGFGCAKDQATGKALIHVSAVARGCKEARNFVQMRMGVAHLFGKGAAQSFKDAIKNFKSAGEIAEPNLQLVAAHLQKMRARMLPQITPRVDNIVMLEAPTSAIRLRG